MTTFETLMFQPFICYPFCNPAGRCHQPPKLYIKFNQVLEGRNIHKPTILAQLKMLKERTMGNMDFKMKAMKHARRDKQEVAAGSRAICMLTVTDTTTNINMQLQFHIQ